MFGSDGSDASRHVHLEGINFGEPGASPRARVGRTACERSLWISSSALECSVAAGVDFEQVCLLLVVTCSYLSLLIVTCSWVARPHLPLLIVTIMQSCSWATARGSTTTAGR